MATEYETRREKTVPRSEGNRRPEDPVDRKVAFRASADLMEQGKRAKQKD